jgi:hypothetical protein
MLQPDAAGVAPPVPVSCHGVASPVALSGFAGTMMLQLTFATATGAVVAVAEGQGVDVGVAVAVAVAVAVEVAVAVGVGVTVVMAVMLGVGVAVAVVTGAVVTGAVVTGAVVTGAVVTGAVVTGAVTVGVAVGKCRCLLLLGACTAAAAADVDTAPPTDVAGAAEVLGEDVVQALARFAALLEAVRLVPKWGAIRNAIPTASTTTKSPAIAARRARGRSSNCR